MSLLRFFVLLLALSLALPITALAFDDDEMTFDLDDIDDDYDDYDDEMVFAPDDLDDFEDGDGSGATLDVGVVVVPGGALSDAQRNDLQQALRDAVRNVPNINVYGDSDLLPALIDRDPEYCSRESLCLAGVGRAAGVQRIVQARVERDGSGYRLDLDYFDVENRLFANYHSNSGLSSMSAVNEALQPGVNDIFNIRTRRGDPGFVDDRDVDVQRVMAYASAGLSVVTLATGIFFGSRVRTQQGEIDQFATDADGRYTGVTQREAQEMQRDMESDALTANVSFGLSAGLAITSVLLFVLQGDDAEARVQFSPSFSDDGVGFGARFNF